MSDCLFCKVVNKEIPSTLLHEDDLVVAFKDINPQAPVHNLIIPKHHYATLNDVGEKQKTLLGHIIVVAGKLAEKEGLTDKGYRLVANCLASAGQSVFHIHFHLLGGRSFNWPPG